MRQSFKLLIIATVVYLTTLCWGQKDHNGAPMFLNVNAIQLDMKKLNGEGQFTSQYSWMLTGGNAAQTELWYYPQDHWHSQLLYQIYNPIALDDSGAVNQTGKWFIIPPEDQSAFRVPGKNVYSWERRRYRPPDITVDGVQLNRGYPWKVYPDLPADQVLVWEDILRNFGIRTRVEVYAFSNANHDNYLIWKATHKFTGETKPAIEDPTIDDFFPDQTIRLWWPLSFSFGPSKAGEYAALGGFSYEGEDDLDSWFVSTSQLVSNRKRQKLKVAYYWDDQATAQAYTNGSVDDSGDPDRTTGRLISPQIPGFALLHSSTVGFMDAVDDTVQPYSMPHATITGDFWGRRDLGRRNTYIGDDSRGRFPLDVISEGWSTSPEKGPMRFITVGPYELEKNSGTNTNDSLCVVYAVGVGSLSFTEAGRIGADWLNGIITDEQKKTALLTGRDSLFQTVDRAFWAWNRDLDIPDPPPPPDVIVTSDANRVGVAWSYPDNSYYLDPDTQVEDWAAWRIYRKIGAIYVNDPLDKKNNLGATWEMIFETADRNTLSYIDNDVTRGVSYYYAVTAIDDGTQNSDGLFPGQALESSRYVNRTTSPAIPFKAGLDRSDEVMVIPNPATINAGALGFPGKEDQILFANLPYRCRLKIFTETGDLVTIIDHFGTDQEVWLQRTDANQYVTSGLYILAVTDAKSITGENIADQFIKFTLIR